MKSIEILSQSFDQSCRAQLIRCQCLVGSYTSRKTPVYNNQLLIIISYRAQPIIRLAYPYSFGQKTELVLLFSVEPERSRGTATEPQLHITRSPEILEAQVCFKS